MITFDPNMHLREIVVVGLGGTGAQVSRSVARLIYEMKRSGLHTPQVRFIDPDTVEEKNIGRQLFSYGDIGHNKAQVLAARFNAALGLDISAVDQPVNAQNHFERYSSSLVIGAVDNEAARCELAKIQGALWLDCGNFKNAGQVVLGNLGDCAAMLRHMKEKSDTYRYLPHAGLLFSALLEPEVVEIPTTTPVSCADLVALGEQALFVNDLMAAVAAQYLWRLLYRQPTHTFVSFIDGDSLSVRSVPICRKELACFLLCEG